MPQANLFLRFTLLQNSKVLTFLLVGHGMVLVECLRVTIVA